MQSEITCRLQKFAHCKLQHCHTANGWISSLLQGCTTRIRIPILLVFRSLPKSDPYTFLPECTWSEHDPVGSILGLPIIKNLKIYKVFVCDDQKYTLISDEIDFPETRSLKNDRVNYRFPITNYKIEQKSRQSNNRKPCSSGANQVCTVELPCWIWGMLLLPHSNPVQTSHHSPKSDIYNGWFLAEKFIKPKLQRFHSEQWALHYGSIRNQTYEQFKL